MNKYQIDKIKEGIWSIGESMVRMFLLDGGTKSILIDTGCAVGNLKETVQSLVRGEVIVLNTHAHGDHTLGNSFFHEFGMHAGDQKEIMANCPENARIRILKDGDIVSAGSISLEVLAVPGHTPGSIALLDKENRVLFSGDMFAKDFPIYMQNPGQDMKQYYLSMKKIMDRIDEFDVACPCHGKLQLHKEDLWNVRKCCEGILDGTVRGEETTLYDGSHARIFRYKDISVFY